MMTNFGRLLWVPADFRKSSQSHKSTETVSSNVHSAAKVIGGNQEYFTSACFCATLFRYVCACVNVSNMTWGTRPLLDR
jgi:hypothetical protein